MYNISYVYKIIDKYTKPLADIKRATKKYQTATKNASRATIGFNNKLRIIKNSIRNVTHSVANSSRKIQDFSSKVKRVGQSLKSSLTIPLTLLATAGVASFAKIEKGLVNAGTLIGKNVFGKFRKQMSSSQKNAIGLGFSIEDVNKALFDNISALGYTKNSIASFKQAQILAIGGVANLGIAVDGITSIVNAYGRETADAKKVANAFFTAQKFGKTTVASLASNIGKLAPIAKAAGISFEELLSTTAALTLGGLSTEEATTALRGAISGLIKPTTEASKILKNLNVPFGATQLRANGLRLALKQLNIANEKFPDLLAKAIPNVRAFTAVMALSDDKLQLIDKSMKQIEIDFKSGTGLIEAYTMQIGLLDHSLKKTWGNLKIISSLVGEVLKPVIVEISKKVERLRKVFDKLNPVTKKLIVIIGGILLVLPFLIIGISGLIFIFGVLLPKILLLVAPFVTLTAVITTLLVFLGYIASKSEMVSSAFLTLSNTLDKILGEIGKPILILYNYLGKLFGLFEEGDETVGLFSASFSVLETVAWTVIKAFQIVFNTILATIQLLKGDFAKAFKTISDPLSLKAEIEKSVSVEQAKNQKIQLGGNIDVTSTNDTKVNEANFFTDFGNLGTSLAGAF